MTVFAIVKSEILMTLKLLKNIDRFGCWARKWGRIFQPVKCNIHVKQIIRKRTNKIEASYTLESTVLKNVDSIEYLKVTLTHDSKWNIHISNMCTTENSSLGFLRWYLYQCPQDVKEAAYRGLVCPILEYGSCVWDPQGMVLNKKLKKFKTGLLGLLLAWNTGKTKMGVSQEKQERQ